jgi:diphthine synthase
MIATTHIDLRLRAEKLGIPCSIIHASSISSAITGTTGLQNYKFGRTVTLPLVKDNNIPESPYEYVYENYKRGLHTLILLDLHVETDEFLRIPEALDVLRRLEVQNRRNLFSDQRIMLAAARIGSPTMVIKGGPLHTLYEYRYGDPPYSLVLPGKLHFMEKEALHILFNIDLEFLGDTI